MTTSISQLPSKRPILSLTIASILALTLAGCGGGGGSDNRVNVDDDNGGASTPPASTTATFSESATWTVSNFTPNTMSCYDFDTQTTTDCSDDNWDIKFENQARGIKLWSNSGDSGTGDGGVFGLIDWSDLGRYNNAVQDPDTSRDITIHYSEDKSGGIFTAEPWFEYNLNGNHQLYPNNRVYLVTSDSTNASAESSVQQPVYALQVINYYNDAGTSGYPTIRWIDTALPTNVRTETINASSNDDWVYFNLTTGQSVTDSDATWHIGFQRNNMILNGGASGSGAVGGFVAATPAGYYDDAGEPINSQFITDGSASTLSALTNTSGYDVPASARNWVIDSNGSDLNPAYTGNYPTLDFGWYTYNGLNHQLSAKPIEDSQGALIRSAEGNSYARMRLDSINYPDDVATTPTSWVFNFDIQPAS